MYDHLVQTTLVPSLVRDPAEGAGATVRGPRARRLAAAVCGDHLGREAPWSNGRFFAAFQQKSFCCGAGHSDQRYLLIPPITGPDARRPAPARVDPAAR